jgi:RNA polymerase sigma-70 factor (ECF subfamily)
MQEPNTGDGGLLHRFCAGDRDAFTTIYRAHQPAIFRFALHMTGDRGAAAELTQDVFVWLIHHAEAFQPERGALGAFLSGVARKLYLRRQYEARRWAPIDDATGAAGDDRSESDTTELKKAIAALPVKYREIVVLCDLEEKSYEEASVLAECAVGTVRSRLHRARGLLAQKLLARRGSRRGEAMRCSV